MNTWIDPAIQHIPPYDVIAAIREWRGDKADETLHQLTYHPLEDFWSVYVHGMFVGIERDGYIHS